ncbi:MAG: chalcone isomerase family protein [Rubrivivax sp.]|nr:chalcone isomerase family protein [Rubrivivax sp.]
MKRRSLVFAPLLCGALPGIGHGQTPTPNPATPPAGVAVSGVNYPTTVQVAGSTLQLNGAGTRYKFVIKVYTAGLYLAARAATPEAVAAAPGPKRLHVVMLREIDANELGKLFTRGMQDNAPRESFSRSIPGTLRMAEIFSSRRKLLAGDSFSVDWVPGNGTTVLVNGQPQGAPIKEPEFFNALMSIWLGQRPADDQLKTALLGEENRAPGDRNRQ